METLRHELKALRGAALRLAGVFLLVSVASFAVPVWGATFSARAVAAIQKTLVPEGVPLITLSPLDPLVSQIIIALQAALFLLLPLLAFEVWRYVSPALYPGERRGLRWFLVFAVALFYVGAGFAYTVLMPAVLRSLFFFLPAGVTPFIGLRELIALTGGFILAVGFLFLLPIAMTLLSATGLVPARWWRSYARHAVLLALICSAILTPDGTGVSMALLAIPICVLYAAGYAGGLLFSRRVGRIS